jgi:hypothetical protein
MQWVQCPLCFTPLESREVTPCYICGGSPSSVEGFRTDQEYRTWRLPSGRELILCHGCELEDFMCRGGWGKRLLPSSLPLAIHHLQFVRKMDRPQLGKDQYCPECNLRLAFITVIAESEEDKQS